MKLHRPHFKKINLKRDKKKIIKFIVVLLLVLIWSFALLVVGPAKLVHLFGETNSLILLFIVGSFGGVSTLTAFFFYSTVISLVSSGLDPLTIGLVGGFAITIGDSLFFYLGHSGREALYGKPKEWALLLSHWLSGLPPYLIPVVTFAYVGLTPFPNDILTVSLGLSGIKYKNIILPIVLGNIFLTLVLAYVAFNGFF